MGRGGRKLETMAMTVALAGCMAGELPDTVLDAAGDPVVGALVTARHEATGRAFTVYTNAEGRYELPDLPADVGVEVRGPAAEARPRATMEGVPHGPLRLGPAPEGDEPPASAFLAQIPDSPQKRRMMVDCGGCHTFNSTHLRKDGRGRTAAEWQAAIGLMLGMAGQDSGFPIISSAAHPEQDAAWLSEALAGAPWPEAAAPEWELLAGAVGAVLTEYDVPEAPGLPVPDLPHDLVVDNRGRVVVTGMFSHRMMVLDPGTGEWTFEPIPVPNANPRAVDIDAEGRWWVLLGQPQSMAVHDPATGEWEVHPIGMYPHSVDLDSAGRVWFNGHFTVAPELMGHLDPATGAVVRYEVPPTADRWASESTIPYGLRVADDDVVWATQLRGNHLVRLDPADDSVRLFEMPTSESGPRRPDPGPDGSIWIPEFGSGKLARFDPVTEAFTEWALPDRDAGPYVVRVDPVRGTVWIATGHGDVVYSFDPAAERFTAYPLPTRGALIRHIDVDERTGELWAAYGASPGIAPRILRIRPAP